MSFNDCQLKSRNSSYMCVWFVIYENMYECTHAHINIKNLKNQN